MKKIPIGLQLYSVRDDCARNLPAVLEAVAKMGYAAVEFAGYHGRNAGELRKMLDNLGLKCCGTHTGMDTLLGDALPKTIEFNLAIGNKFLIVPWLPDQYRDSRAAWRKTAELFNELAAKVKPHGLRVGYHNHDIEFKPVEGVLPWDTFFGTAKPEVVMQVDTGNCLQGKGDPIACLKNYPGRATTVHLKEYAPANPKALVGDGDVKWKEVFAICESIGGTEWYIVEYESDAYPPLECVDRCLKNLRKMGK